MIAGGIKRHLLSLGESIVRRTFRDSRASSWRSMSLSIFLADTKQRYLRSVQEGKGREWLVVMGNEAGDLDSIASSIAYSWFASTGQKISCVALVQTPREDLRLRPENTHAFSLASLSPNQDELLCIDDIPTSTPFPSNRFALVDHNHLLPRFSENNEDVRVVAVLDHHDDEGLYKDSADPRIILVPTGSCTSIVTRYIEQHAPSQIPSEIAQLLLSAILIDTAGLKPGGKAEELDRAAVAYLLPYSELRAATASISATDTESPISALARELLERKFDVGQLSTSDLLRRDYKQYAWQGETRIIHVGLSTVPVDLREWLARTQVEEFWLDVDAFMDKHKLDLLGILTTFREQKRPKKKNRHGGDDEEENKGKHKRQMLIIIRDVPGEDLERRVCQGLESASELALEPRSFHKFASKHRRGEHQSVIPTDGGIGDRKVYTFKQGNARATRKAVAPLMKNIIEGGSATS